MTAPALVMVARGSSDPLVATVTHELARGLQDLRPEMDVYGAFLAYTDYEIGRSIRRGQGPIELRFTLSRPIGPEISLLTILDQRLRSALSQARCLELDGLVLSASCAGDPRGSALLARRARQWSTHHRLPCLTAVADDSGPSVAHAIMGLRAQGRRHIAVGSFFLSADESYHTQSDLAYRFGAVSVSEPIGAAREVLDLVLARYAFAAMDLLDFGADEMAEPVRHLSVVGA